MTIRPRSAGRRRPVAEIRGSEPTGFSRLIVKTAKGRPYKRINDGMSRYVRAYIFVGIAGTKMAREDKFTYHGSVLFTGHGPGDRRDCSIFTDETLVRENNWNETSSVVRDGPYR